MELDMVRALAIPDPTHHQDKERRSSRRRRFQIELEKQLSEKDGDEPQDSADFLPAVTAEEKPDAPPAASPKTEPEPGPADSHPEGVDLEA